MFKKVSGAQTGGAAGNKASDEDSEGRGGGPAGVPHAGKPKVRGKQTHEKA